MQYIIQNNKNHWNHIPKTPLAWKKLPPPPPPPPKKKGRFAHIGNEIKVCSQNKCHHHLSNVCENSFRMFHSNWVISDYHSFVWQFEFPWLNLTNCPNKWMVIRNDPVTVKHTKWIFTDVGKVMMAFILATDFDFIAYMSKMPFFFSFFFEVFFHANGVFGIWYMYALYGQEREWERGTNSHLASGKADLRSAPAEQVELKPRSGNHGIHLAWHMGHLNNLQSLQWSVQFESKARMRWFSKNQHKAIQPCVCIYLKRMTQQ